MRTTGDEQSRSQTRVQQQYVGEIWFGHDSAVEKTKNKLTNWADASVESLSFTDLLTSATGRGSSRWPTTAYSLSCRTRARRSSEPILGSQEAVCSWRLRRPIFYSREAVPLRRRVIETRTEPTGENGEVRRSRWRAETINRALK